LELTVLKHRGYIWVFGGKAFVDDSVVAEAEIMATMREPEVVSA
jgi:3-hydroxymyristoyl/3-hydroxydecanoyl-(acyl carrier protein) dehydratase